MESSIRDVDLGWLAGVIDGEGCIHVDKRGILRLIVTNTDRRMLEKCAQTTGVGHITQMSAQTGRRPAYYWRCHTANAVKVLQAVRLFLVVKGEQADLVLKMAFGRTRNSLGQWRRDETAMRQRAEIAAQLKRLKRSI